LAAAEERHRCELAFSNFSQDPADPLYPVWHRLPKEHKLEAQEIVVEMLQEGKANAVIATELVKCFLN
jgi:DNA-binding NarL/FixJ family response regulator